jgi:chemotaxis protein histidine kinase CheA
MAKNSARDIEVKAFATHHVITQPNPLRKVLRRVAEKDMDDPIARAEQALAGLSGEFKSWMTTEVNRLSSAYVAIRNDGFTKERRDELFHAAHDIKGEAATFGYPAVTSAADSLSRLIEHTPDPNRIPLKLVDQHVDAIRAIYREYARSDAKDLAVSLTKRLREVTDEFLVYQNRDRPDVLEMITGATAPSIVPE